MWEALVIVGRSIAVSGLATLLSTLWSIPISLLLLSHRGRVSKFFQDLFNALVSTPTVVLGLLIYMVFSKSGPLGWFGLLYTPLIISLGQAILVTPLIVSVITAGLLESRWDVWEAAVSLGATRLQASMTLLSEGWVQVLRSIIVGFNRAIGELGVALMVGGNIKGFTRVMTTAIALEASRGEFELAITLGGILIAISIVLTVLSRILGGLLD